MPTRLRKTRKKRGHVTMGYGRIGKHRKHPGGRGMAGGQHHHRTNLDKFHPGYFGKVGMRHYHLNRNHYYCPTINLDKLWSLIPPRKREAFFKSKDDAKLKRKLQVKQIIRKEQKRLKEWRKTKGIPEPLDLRKIRMRRRQRAYEVLKKKRMLRRKKREALKKRNHTMVLQRIKSAKAKKGAKKPIKKEGKKAAGATPETKGAKEAGKKEQKDKKGKKKFEKKDKKAAKDAAKPATEAAKDAAKPAEPTPAELAKKKKHAMIRLAKRRKNLLKRLKERQILSNLMRWRFVRLKTRTKEEKKRSKDKRREVMKRKTTAWKAARAERKAKLEASKKAWDEKVAKWQAAGGKPKEKPKTTPRPPRGAFQPYKHLKAPVIDVTKRGYFKVLGKGHLPAYPIIVKAKFFTKVAVKRIRRAGGACILTA
jgi:ribosomal protein L15